MSKYEYKPLSPYSEAFRLLRVLPSSNFEDPLVCELRHAELTDNPEFASLSYTWGPPVFDHTITLEGLEFKVTGSLDYALRSFRQTGWQMLWADQICINQGSTEERSAQVQLMRKIYGKSKAVFISLGDGGENGREVVGLMWVGYFMYTMLHHASHYLYRGTQAGGWSFSGPETPLYVSNH
jgi:hypothetical protein